MNWRKSTRCDASACVEVAPLSLAVAVRDSTAPGRWLAFPRGEWREFVNNLPNQTTE